VDDRVYRKAMSHRDACRIIISGKGTHFDPNIVDVFEAISDEMAEEAEKSKRLHRK
jgi:putative two-component system response regulator